VQQVEGQLGGVLTLADADELEHARLRARPLAGERSQRPAERERLRDRRRAHGLADPHPDEVRDLRLTHHVGQHPPSTSPTTHSSGTHTSSRKTSLNSASPVSSRSGRTSIPFVVMSTRK